MLHSRQWRSKICNPESIGDDNRGKGTAGSLHHGESPAFPPRHGGAVVPALRGKRGQKSIRQPIRSWKTEEE